MLCFELSMPSPPSWNGRWSGEDRYHAIVRVCRDKNKAAEIVSGGPYTYHWRDGWTALVTVREVTYLEAGKIRRRSVGFAGYDWMVNSIMRCGQIRI